MKGIRVTGALQDWDVYDNRYNIELADFRIPDERCRKLSLEELDDLLSSPYCSHCDDDSVFCKLLEEMARQGVLRGHARSWEWEDPLELEADLDDVRSYIDALSVD